MTAMKPVAINEQSILTTLDISQIKSDLTDFRDRTEEYNDRGSEEFETLKNSIKSFGLITPIHVAETNEGYELIDGRRRLLAAKQIGLKQVPVLLIHDNVNKERLAVITLVQNLHRKDLNDSETARGIAKLFEMHGYSKEVAKTNVKILHNKDSFTDSKFKKILDSIGYKPNYVYQLLQLVVELDPEVLDYAEDKSLAINKKILLTNKDFRGKPEKQKQLARNISGRSIEDAREIAHKMAINERKGIETIDEPEFEGKPEIAKHPYLFYSESTANATALLRSLTGHTLSRGEVEYTSKHIENTKQHRKDMVAAIGEQVAWSFATKLSVLQEALTDIMEEVQKRYPA